ncbi:MAG: TetR/AcrR family transcriptional regulator [Planctomycetaceae bacterium]|nr:TetR/AcrR family transcriptional regulator [Planctomycetaceae bacterium]
MSGSTRKQREIAEREQKILSVAARIFRTVGYHGLNMEEIASEIGCSKGTVYGHYRNKEDILMAMASRGVETRADLFSQAAAFPGRARERMLVLWMSLERFVQEYSHYFAAEIILRTETLREKAAPERQESLRAGESRCLQIVAGLIRDGIAQGDLQLTDGMTPEELAYGLWATAFGGHTLWQTGPSSKIYGVKAPLETILQSVSLILDGMGWQPLSSRLDRDKLRQQAEQLVSEVDFE